MFLKSPFGKVTIKYVCMLILSMLNSLQAVGFLPKIVCNVKEVEFARAVKLNKTFIELLSFQVPRVKVCFNLINLFFWHTDTDMVLSAFYVNRWSTSRMTFSQIQEYGGSLHWLVISGLLVKMVHRKGCHLDQLTWSHVSFKLFQNLAWTKWILWN